MVRAVEIFASINFIVMGLSHIFQPRAWHEFFTFLHSKGIPGSFFNAFLALGMGSIVVAFHNVWSGVPMILTIYGWASILKGGLFLLVPSLGLRSLEKGISMDPKKWVIPGLVLLTLGVVLLLLGTTA